MVQRRPLLLRVADMGPTVAEVSVGAEPGAADDFDAWVIAMSPRLVRLAGLIGHPPHAAADAVQDALVAVLVRWRRLSEPGAADAYARRVIVNRRISWWRSIGRREQLSADPSVAAGTVPDRAHDALVARQLLPRLPDRQRAAVVLRYFEDLSFAEIADLLGCPEATARSHVHRALARLRTMLTEEDR